MIVDNWQQYSAQLNHFSGITVHILHPEKEYVGGAVRIKDKWHTLGGTASFVHLQSLKKGRMQRLVFRFVGHCLHKLSEHALVLKLRPLFWNSAVCSRASKQHKQWYKVAKIKRMALHHNIKTMEVLFQKYYVHRKHMSIGRGSSLAKL